MIDDNFYLHGQLSTDKEYIKLPEGSKSNMSIDPKVIDRWLVGERLYDALDFCNRDNKFKTVQELYSDDKVIERIHHINKSDLLELVKLVNGSKDLEGISYSIEVD